MLGLLLTIKLRLLIITQSFLPKSRLLEDDSRKYLWNECPVAGGVDAHRVMLSGMHVIPLSQRETGLCVQVTAEDGRKLVPARAACSAVPVVLAVWRCVFAPSWEWQHSVVEVFIIFLMRNYTRFPRDIPIDPLDSSALTSFCCLRLTAVWTPFSVPYLHLLPSLEHFLVSCRWGLLGIQWGWS